MTGPRSPRAPTASRWLPLALALLCPAASALSTDKQQPIEVEADSAELDKNQDVSVYRGNVVVTQGSIRMTGDEMTVYSSDNENVDRLILTGKPATYRQLPDNGKVNDEARASRMEYYHEKNLVVLVGGAVVTQEGLRFSGDRIEYDTAQSKVRAFSQPPAGTSPEKPAGGRVKIIIKKKDKDTPDAP